MATLKGKRSLISPDFTGLWSYNHCGKANDTFSVVIGCFAISMLIYPWILGFFMPFIILLLLYFQQWALALTITSILIYPYFVTIQPWDFWRKFVLMGCHYFMGGVSTCFEHEVDFEHPMLIGVHPHGLFSFGPFFAGLKGRTCTDRDFSASKPGMIQTLSAYGLIDSKLLQSPIFHHVVVGWLGKFLPASKQSVISVFREHKESVYLIPGGFNEAALLKRDTDIVYIKNRKGFIKYALQHGVPILPGYTFGECHTYHTLLSGESALKSWMNNHKLPCVLFSGPLASGCLLPYRDTGIHTVFGKLQKIPKIERPSMEDVEKYHALYVQELLRIFNDNKWRFGMEDKELVVV